MKHLATKMTTLAVTLALTAIPLAGCGGATSTDDGAAEPSPAASQGAEIDMSSWQTMGDALAIADTNDIAYGYDDKVFVCVFESGDALIRTRAEMQPDVQGKIYDLDMGDDDYREKFAQIVGNLKLIDAADISGELLSQEDLEQYMGKTGQDLVDAGFIFASYSFYGGEQTGADLDKGNFSYSFTFDTQTSEDQTEDEGASIMGAPVVEVQSLGNLSGAALDPASME